MAALSTLKIGVITTLFPPNQGECVSTKLVGPNGHIYDLQKIPQPTVIKGKYLTFKSANPPVAVESKGSFYFSLWGAAMLEGLCAPSFVVFDAHNITHASIPSSSSEVDSKTSKSCVDGMSTLQPPGWTYDAATKRAVAVFGSKNPLYDNALVSIGCYDAHGKARTGGDNDTALRLSKVDLVKADSILTQNEGRLSFYLTSGLMCPAGKEVADNEVKPVAAVGEEKSDEGSQTKKKSTHWTRHPALKVTIGVGFCLLAVGFLAVARMKPVDKFTAGHMDEEALVSYFASDSASDMSSVSSDAQTGEYQPYPSVAPQGGTALDI